MIIKFNNNKSCIEIRQFASDLGMAQSLIITRVVLK